MTVGLVIVSHSDQLSRGVVELAAQMAPEVRVLAAGGLADGNVGTDFDKVSAALSDADSGSGVVVLYDLGSAQMTAELAVETLGDPSTAIVADAPLVEGAVAAGVAAQGGNALDTVARSAAEAVRAQATDAAEAAEAGAPAEETGGPAGTEISEQLVLRNEVGLHARPAALLARTLTGLDASVSVDLGEHRADAASVLSVMGLGARKDDSITVRATGADAQQAVERVRDLVGRDFDE